MNGSFANVVDGGTLPTADGSGQFTVNFGPGNSVVLSDFSVDIITHGDVNLDGVVNFLDISPFIMALTMGNMGEFQAQADCNDDGVVNFLDISPFIIALTGGGGA